MQIRYRNGYPTKKSITSVIEHFFGDGYRPRVSGVYGTHSGSLVWSSPRINERIPEFIDHLRGIGIEVSEWRPYNSPITGLLLIKTH